MAHGLYMQPEKFPERDRHEVPSLDAYRQRCPKEMLPETHYERMRRMGLEYGPMFQGIMEIHWGTREALVAISLPALLKGESHRYQIHPVLLDACFQSLAIAATGLKDGEEALENVSYLPIGFERIRFLDQPGTDIWCFAEIEDEAEWGAPTLKGDLTLLHSDGTWIGRIEGFEVARMDGDAKLRAEGVFYDLAWKHAEHALNERSQDPATWVIVKDRHGTGDRLAHLLGEKGDSVIQVAVGPDQTEVQAPEHGLSPDEPEQMKQTWQELLSLTEGKKTNVVYLMGLDYPGSHWTAENLEKAEREMTGCLLALIQTLIDQPGREARIWTVTVGAQSNGDSSPVSIAQSSLWGFSRTLSVAHPEWWGGLIDLDPASSHEERAQSILRETMLSDGEDQVMIRGSERYVARLVRKDLKPDTDSFEVRLDSSYLITGGLGELGLLFARWLVKRGARHLVLVGRTPLPPRSDWPSIQEGDRFYRQVRGVMELESMGAEVELAFFDVADEQKVRAYLSRHQREGKPPIRGILHLAGVVRNQSFSELDLEDLWSIYRPKVIGSWVLHQLFPAGTLDFFILFSSFTSMISPPRLAAYAGANAFMDALAKERSRLDQATISIAWGPWAEGGMAVRADGQGQVASDTTAGMKNMSPDEGLAAFEEIWRHPVPFIAVADVDWTEWSRWFAIASEAPLLRDLIRESADPVETAELPATSISQALAQTHSDERHSLIVQFLREQVADVMRFDVYQVAADQPLSQLGLDSMMAVELKNRIDRELRVTLPMVAFLSGPSIHELAEKVDRLIDDDHLEADSQVNLPRVETKEFPLSYGQRSLWFLHQVAPDSAAYHVGFAVKIESEMDDEAFRRAWTQVVRRQPSLRTTFKVEQGEPIQAVHDDVDVPLEEVDASAWDEPMLRERMDRDYRRPFDLSKGPIWRGVLYRKAASETVFLLVVHHIAIDFWGIEVLLDELRRFYEAEVSGKSADLAPLSAVYADFVQWQNRMLEGKEGKKQEAFWHKELAGELPDLQLPTDKPRPKQPSYRGDSVPFSFDPTLTKRLKEWAREENVTLFTLLLAGFQALLHRYSGQPEVIVGSPVTGRSRPEFEDVVGDFINMLPYRADFSGSPSFRKLLQQVKEKVLAGLEHQDYPFPLLVEQLKPHRDAGRSPIFQVAFILQNLVRFKELAEFMVFGESEAEIDFGGMAIRPFPIAQQEGQMDITLEMGEANGRLFGVWKYSTDLFNRHTIERMAAHFEELLRNALAEPDTSVSRLSILTKEEKEVLLQKWQGPKTAYSDGALLHQLFETQVDLTPDRVAVEFAGEGLTYRELDQRANRLARRLKRLGVKPQSTVGICVERSLDMLVALLAALKACATYVPMDPTFPKQRLEWMVEDAHVSVLISQEKLVHHLPPIDGRVILLDRDQDEIESESAERLEAEIEPDALAYMIFTSGSTGRPKGVEIPHRAVVNFMESMRNQPGIHQDDVWVAVTTLSFDIALLELFLPLTAGAKVVIASRETALDGLNLLNLMEATGVTIMQATPATWRLLLEAGWQGTKGLKILCGGESLPRDLAAELLKRCASLWNMYGPTEATIWMTVEKIDGADGPISIGRPIDNMETYILDEHLQPVPVGVVGELHIGGTGLARGYHGRPDLTDEKFIPHPFKKDEKLYKSGDLARYLPDGRIECLGRIDHQVKIRGFRIELGDIEAALTLHEGIRQAVVMAHEDIPGEKRLVAYYVGDESLTVSDLRQHLKGQLPDYMIPSVFMALTEMPLTPNGKVDRKALPAPDASEMKREYVEPKNETEAMIADIWAEVLRLEKVGATDHFFELGGTSLLAAKAHRLLSEKVDKPLTIIDLFQYPTVQALAEYMTQGEKKSPVEVRAEQLGKGKNRFKERLKRRKALNKR